MRKPRTLATIITLVALALTTGLTAAGLPSEETGASQEPAVNRVLDDFHQAAAEADEARYFDHLAEGAVFLGTDASERWTKTAFREFAHPHFAAGRGWKFTPTERHLAFSADGSTAWFDELLASESYGTCRGSGVLQRVAGQWKIEHYHLTIPIPNDLAKEFVARIRESAARKVGSDSQGEAP